MLWVIATYCLLMLGNVAFQFALIAGAPWGRITQGGAHKGPLPRRGRIIAAVSAVLLVLMALSVVAKAGYLSDWPAWTYWTTVVIQGISMILNWITPSAAERRLWGPITLVLFGLAASVGWLPPQ